MSNYKNPFSSRQTHRVESMEWLELRSKAASRAHPEVWQNLEGELNDGPACRCSAKARETGTVLGTNALS